MMANEWIEDEGASQAALEGAAAESEAAEIRYRLTPLGALALDEAEATPLVAHAEDGYAFAGDGARRRPSLTGACSRERASRH